MDIKIAHLQYKYVVHSGCDAGIGMDIGSRIPKFYNYTYRKAKKQVPLDK